MFPEPILAVKRCRWFSVQVRGVIMYKNRLQNLCNLYNLSSFPLHSRVHRMQEEPLYVKREDELGFGVSGSKLRKYVSILPVLKKDNKRVAIVGSLNSNHVLSLLQLVKQEGIGYQLFLERPNESDLKGNAFFLSLLIKKHEVLWVEKVPDLLDNEWKAGWEKKLDETFFWISMGGCMKEALMGSLTLPLDLLQNEEDLELSFRHVFIDSGTGMSAIGLILGLAYLRKNIKIHVVLVAGKEVEFSEKLTFFHNHLQKLLQESFSIDSYRCLFPVTAKSFGSHNASIFKEIKETAEKEGFFLDPIYSAKLLLTTKKMVKEEGLDGNILWIHSGGALSLSGFQSVSYFRKD